MTQYITKKAVVTSVEQRQSVGLSDTIILDLETEDGEQFNINITDFGWLSDYVSKSGGRIPSCHEELRDDIYGDEVELILSEDEELEAFAEPDSARLSYFIDSHQNMSGQFRTTP